MPLQVNIFHIRKKERHHGSATNTLVHKTVEALQLNGKGERTQQAYARAVRMLIEFHGKGLTIADADDAEAPSAPRRHLSVRFVEGRFGLVALTRVCRAVILPCMILPIGYG